MAPHIAIPIVVSAAAAIAAWLAHRSHGQPRRTPVRAFYLLDQADTDELPFLEKAAAIRHGVSLTWGTTLEEGPPASDVNVLVTRLPTAEALDKWTSLRWVIVPFAGPTEKTRQLLRERPRLSLHNAHFNAQSTSELAVGLLLAAAKRIVTRETTLRREAQAAEHAWTPGWMVTDGSAAVPTLGGRVALVLGYGAIGKRVAKALDGLGMEVHACRRSATHQHQDGVATVHGMGMLHQLLSTSFVLIVCVPGTADTEKLIGAAELAMMPSGSLLVNVGRGSVIDEHALYEALQRGHLGGAGIDVWYNYPMLPGQGLGADGQLSLGPSSVECPFHTLPNVVMSPHTGQSSTSKANDRVTELISMLEQLGTTGQMPNRFDIERGY